MFVTSLRSKLRIQLGKQRQKKLLNCIGKLPSDISVTLIDIGAADEIQQRWSEISSVLNYVGFEPDLRSRELLLMKPQNCKSYKLLPNIVSDNSETVVLNLTKKPQVSSIFEPNLEILNQFPDIERFEIVSKESVETTRLDELKLNADFIKLDIQGAELKALNGAKILLEDTLGIEIEIEFIEIYKNQPKFAEINSWLEGQGFTLLDFVNIYRWQRESFNGLGQVIFIEGLFIKSPETVIQKNLSLEKMNSYFIILLLYKRFDMINTYFQLLPPEAKIQFKKFVYECGLLEKKHEKFNRFNYWVNFIIKLVDPGYQSHLLY
jgi:FkbM family methyltransferase